MAIAIWAVYPFLPAFESPKTSVQAVASQDVNPAASRTKAQKKKAKVSRPPPPPEQIVPPAQAKTFSQREALLRAILVPLLPVLTSTILRSPTLPQPLIEPYNHPSYPLRILSSAHSTFSSVVVVGEALPPPPNADISLTGPHSLRYLRAGHSLLGGVWIGAKVQVEDGFEPVHDEAGESLGDSIYSAFVLQEAARLANKRDGEPRESALIMYALLTLRNRPLTSQTLIEA